MRKAYSTEDLLVAADVIMKEAKRQGSRVIIVGGLAMHLHGSDRLTGDVDILSEKPLRLGRVTRKLTFGGESCRGPRGIPVDVIRRSDKYARLYQAALRSSPIRAAGLPFVGVPYLVAMKMQAGRSRDEHDLMFLLSKIHPENLQSARVVVRRHLGEYALDGLDNLRREALWRKAEGKL